MRKIILMLLLVSFVSGQCFAKDDKLLNNSGQDMLIVLGCGLSGAILGLSTLSFVEEPGDHLNNIVVGGAIGLIVGVAAVAWNQASNSQNAYSEMAKVSPNFNTSNRYSWHQRAHQQSLSRSGFRPSDVGYSFKF